MAESPSLEEREAGAPVAPDAIDPELIKLKRSPPKIGMITAAGVVVLCVMFLLRLGPDRRFGGQGDQPRQLAASAVAGADTEQFVVMAAEPVLGHAVRTTTSKGDVGLRVAPVRGSDNALWIVMDGDGWTAPALDGYRGRLRHLSDLPFGDEVRELVASQPRVELATPAALRAAFVAGPGGGGVKTVAGNTVAVPDAARAVFDTLDPQAARLVASFNENQPSVDAWLLAIDRAGIPLASRTPAEMTGRQATFAVGLPVKDLTAKLEAAELFAARVDPVKRHYETTYGAIKQSPPGGLAGGAGAVIPDAQVDLVGLYVTAEVPSGAYALVVGEQPQDYWYVMPITVALIAIGLLFAWALVRAVRRDLLPARA